MSDIGVVCGQVLSGSEGAPILDYGMVFTGKVATLPLHLVNHGNTSAPVRLALVTVSSACMLMWHCSMSCDYHHTHQATSSLFCYTFIDPPKKLISPQSLPGSALSSRSNTLKLVLPAKKTPMEVNAVCVSSDVIWCTCICTLYIVLTVV